MAAKFNKEALLKHRFWVLIAVTSCVTLAGIGYLQLYGSSEAHKKRADMSGKIKGLGGVKGASNDKVITHWGDKAAAAKKSESTVWSEAYDVQKPIYTWAPEVETRFHFSDGYFAHDIKISKATPDVTQWPPDTAGSLLHGTLTDVRLESLDVKTRDGKVATIYRMATDKLITDSEGAEGKKNIDWGSNELEKHKGKLLAITYQVGKYFGDKLLQEEQDAFGDREKRTYEGQIHEILRSVDPYTEKGTGVVQLRNWPYQKDKLPDSHDSVKFIRFMNKEKGWDLTRDFSKEAWIAQEDIWVQHEVYRIIRAANDEISAFHGKGGNVKDKAYSFKNANFALELHLKSDGVLGFKITNLLSRRQKLDLKFKVRMNENKGFDPEVISVSGLPLGPNASHTEDFPVKKEEAQRVGIFKVQQMLTWETAAVKRIDHVAMGSIENGDIAHSHRDFIRELRPFDEKDAAKDEKKDAGSGAPPGAGGSEMKVKLGADLQMGMGGVGGAGRGSGTNKTLLPHGFWTDRYVEVTEQSRRIPVAVALIVDQEHVDRVLTQFMNSKLRFLESQILLNHHAGSLTPRLEDGEDKGGGTYSPPKGFGPPGPMNPGSFKSGSGLGVPPAFGQPSGGNTGSAQAAAAGQDETNMELVIYGVMTLYNRYPPRPKQ